MREIELESRTCLEDKCGRSFRVTPNNKQAFCSTYCLNKYESIKGNTPWRNHNREAAAKAKQNRKQEMSEKMDSSGILGPGDRQRAMKKEDSKNKNTFSDLISKNVRPLSAGKNTIQVPSFGSQRKSEIKEDTKTIESVKLSADVSIAELIEQKRIEEGENIMPKTEKTSSEKSSSEGKEMIQQSDSTQLSTILKTENESSIQLLNSSARQLQGYAEGLAKPRKIDDDGEVIQRSTSHDLMTAVGCLSQLNAIMKTKLDYLKFAKEVNDEHSNK